MTRKEYYHAWYLANRAHVMAKSREWVANNRERLNARNRAYAKRRRQLRGPIPRKRRSPKCTQCASSDLFVFYRRSNGHFIQPCKICRAKRDRKLSPEMAARHNEKQKRYIRGAGRNVYLAWRQRPQTRLSHTLRQRLRSAIHTHDKYCHTFELVGCDISFLMSYIQARFTKQMSWDNYGTFWEIDHRIPCAKFDLTDHGQQRACFHYSNLQPLSCYDNGRKSAKMPPPHQAELI